MRGHAHVLQGDVGQLLQYMLHRQVLPGSTCCCDAALCAMMLPRLLLALGPPASFFLGDVVDVGALGRSRGSHDCPHYQQAGSGFMKQPRLQARPFEST